MIRVLLVALGLALGLALSVPVFGRMAHLRGVAAATGHTLPDWTLAVDADATALSGRAQGPGGVALSWRLAGAGWHGPVWRLRIDGRGTALMISARPDPLRRGLTLSDAQGAATLTGGRLSGHFLGVTGAGRVTAQGLWLDLHAQGQRLRLDGQDLPDGPATLSLTPGGWRLVPGGQGGAQGGGQGGAQSGTAFHEVLGP